MAKKKSAKQRAESGRPGIEGGRVKRHASAPRRSRRSWTFDLVLVEPPTELDDHPLVGLTCEQREVIRAQALGRVLAAIAVRKAGASLGEPAESADQRIRSSHPHSNRDQIVSERPTPPEQPLINDLHPKSPVGRE